MRWVFLYHSASNSETPQGKVHSSASNRPSGCTRLPRLIMHQLHSAKWSSIYTNCQVIKGQLTAEHFTLTKDQLIHLLNCTLLRQCAVFRLKLFYPSFPFPSSSGYLKEQMKRNTAEWYYLVVFPVFCAAIGFIWTGIEGSCKVVCDVRVGASCWCCCEWPLDVTCQ